MTDLQQVDPIKIVMVTNHFHPSSGGLERQAKTLATQLVHNGCSLIVVTPQYEGLSKLEEIDSVSIERFPVLGSPHVRYGFIRKLYYAISLFYCLFKKRDNIDIIHVHQALFAAFVCTIFGKILDKKIIVKVSGSGAYGNMHVLNDYFWDGRFMLKVIKQADAFVSLSSETTEEILENGFDPLKIHYIPNGVSAPDVYSGPEINAIKSHYRIPQDFFICSFTGRLCVEKNLYTLLDAWDKVWVHHQKSCLVLAGDGPECGELKTYAAALGCARSILFTGHMSDVSPLLKISHCFVLPSKSEGMSNSLLEAMSFGLPCIASDIPGNAAIIDANINGLLFNQNDYTDLAKAILWVIENKALAAELGENAKMKVINNHTVEHVALSYQALYSRLLAVKN